MRNHSTCVFAVGGVATILTMRARIMMRNRGGTAISRYVRALNQSASGRKSATSKLSALRVLMQEEQVSAYVVPSSDAHQSEYVAPRDQRRAYISNFTGSAGTAVVTPTEALLWTDGRYFLQAKDQLSAEWTLMKDRLKETPTIEEYLSKVLQEGDAVGFDPMHFSIAQAQAFDAKLRKRGVVLKPIKTNLVDVVWNQRDVQPEAPRGQIRAHPLKFAGQDAASKIENLREDIRNAGAACALITSLDEIAWICNIRGSDIPMCPVCISFLIVSDDACYLFVDSENKMSSATETSVRDGCGGKLVLRPYSLAAVRETVSDMLLSYKKKDFGVMLDPSSCNRALADVIEEVGAKLFQRSSPVSPRKAKKNAAEIEGLRAAHVRDGAAVVRFLCWLEYEIARRGHSDDERPITECEAADRLEAFRKEMSPNEFVGLSFDTIAGSGPNGAIIHYKPEPGTDGTLTKEKMFLCDSGAQYIDGTTDITRTVHFGAPTKHEIRCFTRVLQGHIDLAAAVFPQGTSGYQLDFLARSWLFRDGLDYNHGTGHGVGAFLNVHEGPHGINAYVRSDAVKLETGYTVTDEPGYYEDGKFGIRHENVLVVVDAVTPHNFGGKKFHAMESITFVPFQRRCMDVRMMTDHQIAWLDSYHRKCREILTPVLRKCGDGRALEYLQRETRPLTEQ